MNATLNASNVVDRMLARFEPSRNDNPKAHMVWHSCPDSRPVHEWRLGDVKEAIYLPAGTDCPACHGIIGDLPEPPSKLRQAVPKLRTVLEQYGLFEAIRYAGVLLRNR
jgi:hypothetical protein